MREIKFKARAKWNNQIYDVVEICLFAQNVTLAGAEHRLTTSYSSIDLMEYTGIKDSQGVEIYEGYIGESGGVFGVVKYKDGVWWLGSDFLRDCEVEIKGNIYENPELMEVK